MRIALPRRGAACRALRAGPREPTSASKPPSAISTPPNQIQCHERLPPQPELPAPALRPRRRSRRRAARSSGQHRGFAGLGRGEGKVRACGWSVTPCRRAARSGRFERGPVGAGDRLYADQRPATARPRASRRLAPRPALRVKALSEPSRTAPRRPRNGRSPCPRSRAGGGAGSARAAARGCRTADARGDDQAEQRQQPDPGREQTRRAARAPRADRHDTPCIRLRYGRAATAAAGRPPAPRRGSAGRGSGDRVEIGRADRDSPLERLGSSG